MTPRKLILYIYKKAQTYKEKNVKFMTTLMTQDSQ